jgi:hypothetical protein
MNSDICDLRFRFVRHMLKFYWRMHAYIGLNVYGWANRVPDILLSSRLVSLAQVNGFCLELCRNFRYGSRN